MDDTYPIKTHSGVVVGTITLSSPEVKRALEENNIFVLQGVTVINSVQINSLVRTYQERVLEECVIQPLPTTPATPKTNQEAMKRAAEHMDAAATELKRMSE